MQNTMQAVHFTYATELYTIRYADKTTQKFTYSQLAEEFGEEKADTLSGIAFRMTGHWQTI